jgi:DNA-3-methyladenine glycosylase I
MERKASPHANHLGVRACLWPREDVLMRKYHDREWGRPVRNDRKIFEFLTLEGAQAGLSWLTILRRREGYRQAFANFDPRKVAKFNKRDVGRLMRDAGIIRNRLKIESTINNAKRFLEVQKEFGTFSKYMWSFVEDKPIDGKRRNEKSIPATSIESDILSNDLKKRGFKFVGSTIIYAHMQAVGMINDHIVTCPFYKS